MTTILTIRFADASREPLQMDLSAVGSYGYHTMYYPYGTASNHVSQVKQQITCQTGIPMNQLRLFYPDRLDDVDELAENYLVPNLRQRIFGPVLNVHLGTKSSDDMSTSSHSMQFPHCLHMVAPAFRCHSE
jgi:hypothetical protein